MAEYQGDFDCELKREIHHEMYILLWIKMIR